MAKAKKRVLVDVVAIGRKGGQNSRKNLPEEQRSELGKKAAASRWDNMSEAERKAHGAMLAAARAKKRAASGAKKKKGK